MSYLDLFVIILHFCFFLERLQRWYNPHQLTRLNGSTEDLFCLFLSVHWLDRTDVCREALVVFRRADV